MPAIAPGQRKKPARKSPAKTSTKSKVGTRAQLDSWKPPPKAPVPLIRGPATSTKTKAASTNTGWRKAAATPQTPARKKRNAALAKVAQARSAENQAYKNLVKEGTKGWVDAMSKSSKTKIKFQRKYGRGKAPTTRKRKTGPQ